MSLDACCSIPTDRTDQCRVDRQLRPMEEGSPLANTSMVLWSKMGASKFIRLRGTFVATRAPASRQIRARARSSGTARDRKTPACAQAARWSPRASNGRRQEQVWAVGGSGSRRRRSRRIRKSGFSKRNSMAVGNAVIARLACVPASEKSKT